MYIEVRNFCSRNLNENHKSGKMPPLEFFDLDRTMSERLENGIEYSREELHAWLETRSRICSTPLWRRALEGKEVFEVGDYTYKINPASPERYLVKCIKTSDLINPPTNLATLKRISKYCFLAFCLFGVFIALYAAKHGLSLS